MYVWQVEMQLFVYYNHCLHICLQKHQQRYCVRNVVPTTEISVRSKSKTCGKNRGL